MTLSKVEDPTSEEECSSSHRQTSRALPRTALTAEWVTRPSADVTELCTRAAPGQQNVPSRVCRTRRVQSLHRTIASVACVFHRYQVRSRLSQELVAVEII
ncbi:hypothetical protein J6590_036863 [Homalodisca vitripennis]|nr:hypothetical protein J6590_036863 [Homalodisca vitripennis]